MPSPSESVSGKPGQRSTSPQTPSLSESSSGFQTGKGRKHHRCHHHHYLPHLCNIERSAQRNSEMYFPNSKWLQYRKIITSLLGVRGLIWTSKSLELVAVPPGTMFGYELTVLNRKVVNALLVEIVAETFFNGS